MIFIFITVVNGHTAILWDFTHRSPITEDDLSDLVCLYFNNTVTIKKNHSGLWFYFVVSKYSCAYNESINKYFKQ